MVKTAPSFQRLAVMFVFVATCFGFGLYLWLSFGGSTPLQPRSYSIDIAFPKAFQLPEQASVREAGVPIGKVSNLRPDPAANRTVATIELEARYAPIYRDARAILRTKSVGGETYVALRRGTPAAGRLKDGARLADDQVEDIQTIEDVFQIFDPATRDRFRTWQRSLGRAVDDRGADVNAALGTLPSLTSDADAVLGVLDRDRAALGRLTRDSALVFDALSSDVDALQTAVTSLDTTLSATAWQDDAIARSIDLLPSFMATSRAALDDLSSFAVEADPLVVDLKPALDHLPPALRETRALAPDLRSLFANLGGVYDAAREGLPAVSRVVRGTRPLLRSLGPFLEQLNPILQWLEQNQTVTSDFFSEGITALSSSSPVPGTPEAGGHYLRQIDPGGPEAVSVNIDRLPSNRGNAYVNQLDLGALWQQNEIWPSFDCNHAGGEQRASATAPACYIQDPRTIDGERQGRFPHVGPEDYSGSR